MTQPTLTLTPEIMRLGETAKVYRQQKGTYRKGEWSKGECCEFNIIANIQPVTGMSLLQVPEGERHRRHYNVFTTSELKIRDIIVQGNYKYEVQTSEDWGKYFRMRVVLLDGQENS